jgi:hypothetical protein
MLEGEFLPDFAAPYPALDDAMEETQQIRQIKPKPAIDASCVQAAAQKRVVSLDQHAAFALETMHRVSV